MCTSYHNGALTKVMTIDAQINDVAIHGSLGFFFIPRYKAILKKIIVWNRRLEVSRKEGGIIFEVELLI